jgi:glycosyltransferase involved in cell wall biosynthesis
VTTKPQASILRDEVRRQVESIGEVDVLVGIPSYNNARTIGHVVHAVTAGLAKYFPDQRAVLVNSDGGSRDGTPDVVRGSEFATARTILVSHPVRTLHKVITAYQGLPGKGSAFRTVFEVAARLGARACVVVDSDLRSITPEWMQLLLGPVLHEGKDYVCPLYARHKYDGTITNSIVYPLVRALYGRRIRQPIGGDFGFSGRLAAHYLTHDVWDSDVARYGIDIWMTTTALVGDFSVCQSYLGAKIHDAKDPGADLSAMLMQVTGALFEQAGATHAAWKDIRGSEPVPEFGFRYEVGLEPVPVNTARMVKAFEQGVRDFEPLHAKFLSPDVRRALWALVGQPPETFMMPVDLWVWIVYEYLLGHRARRMNPQHLLQTLTPLYLGRTASWVNQAASFGAADVEVELDALCERFEVMKPVLVEGWSEGRSR